MGAYTPSLLPIPSLTHPKTTPLQQSKYALDFSTRAISLVKQHPAYKASRRCRAFVCDLVNDPVPGAVAEERGGA